MGDTSKRMDIEKLHSLANDLSCMLNDGNDGENEMQFLENVNSLRSFCEINVHETNLSLLGYQKRIFGCEEKIKKVKGELVTDSELNLQTQLEEKMQMEVLLRKEHREVGEQLDSLEQQRNSFEKRLQLAKQMNKQVQRSKDSLSMLASVTGIISENTDKAKISGVIVERSKKKVIRFEADPGMSQFDCCNWLWEMASQ